MFLLRTQTYSAEDTEFLQVRNLLEGQTEVTGQYKGSTESTKLAIN